MATLASSGSVHSVVQSSSERLPSTSSSGISSWILDSGASFHMTSDSISLTSIRPLAAPITVQTTDGTQDEALFRIPLFIFLLFLMFPN